ncbi:MAG: hypothetical protein CM15mP120_05020 [Pseudomonadota bacterium]|nr:MAG: hypothetical protein CM15mP120_05020 [Pseudomonadota bacterium]
MLGYDSTSGRHMGSIMFNVFGERLYTAGRNGAEDLYEQPFNSLDATYSFFPTENVTIKLKLMNLLTKRSLLNARASWSSRKSQVWRSARRQSTIFRTCSKPSRLPIKPLVGTRRLALYSVAIATGDKGRRVSEETITPHNWNTAPYNRTSFQQVQQLFLPRVYGAVTDPQQRWRHTR